jgi:hypothetical protein
MAGSERELVRKNEAAKGTCGRGGCVSLILKQVRVGLIEELNFPISPFKLDSREH